MITKLRKILKALLRSKSGDLDSGSPHQEDLELVDAIKNARLTYLDDGKLLSLIQTLRSIEKSAIPGMVIEAGCALGGSSILMTQIKKSERALKVYDVFGMIPPPTEEDTPDVHERYEKIVNGSSSGIAGDKYYGYEDDLYSKVISNFRSFDIDLEVANVQLIRGLVQDTLNPVDSVSLAHIDVDWYDPVMTCLERIYPQLSVGGSIILDDYHDWGGCRKAADEFLGRVAGKYLLDDSMGSMKITKI